MRSKRFKKNRAARIALCQPWEIKQQEKIYKELMTRVEAESAVEMKDEEDEIKDEGVAAMDVEPAAEKKAKKKKSRVKVTLVAK